MKKILLALALSAFAITLFAADTDNQTDGAELGTNETPQAQDQSKNSNKSTTSNKRINKHKRTNAKSKHNHSKAGSSEENPLQPTESEPAPGASTK
jgi:Ni/Co efflux regulator RcnB